MLTHDIYCTIIDNHNDTDNNNNDNDSDNSNGNRNDILTITQWEKCWFSETKWKSRMSNRMEQYVAIGKNTHTSLGIQSIIWIRWPSTATVYHLIYSLSLLCCFYVSNKVCLFWIDFQSQPKTKTKPIRSSSSSSYCIIVCGSVCVCSRCLFHCHYIQHGWFHFSISRRLTVVEVLSYWIWIQILRLTTSNSFPFCVFEQFSSIKSHRLRLFYTSFSFISGFYCLLFTTSSVKDAHNTLAVRRSIN